jgi:hypothetical protein
MALKSRLTRRSERMPSRMLALVRVLGDLGSSLSSGSRSWLRRGTRINSSSSGVASTRSDGLSGSVHVREYLSSMVVVPERMPLARWRGSDRVLSPLSGLACRPIPQRGLHMCDYQERRALIIIDVVRNIWLCGKKARPRPARQRSSIVMHLGRM